ncbi:MAG: DMT family transporter [Acidimicrobiia bacterium]
MRARAIGLVVLAAVLWGTTGTAQALGGAEESPFSLGAVRMAIGAVALGVVGWRGMKPPRWLAFMVAAMAMAGYQVAFFAGVPRTGVALGSVVAIGSAPVLAGLLAWLVRGERPETRWWIATGMAIIGVALIAGRPGEADVLGIVLVSLSGMGYAVYAVATKYLLEEMSPQAAMAAVFAGAALLLAPFLAFADLEWLGQPQGVAAALWLGVGVTALAYLAFARGLVHLSVGDATTVSLAEPATATMLGVFLLGERASWPAWLGVGLVLGAVAVLGRPKPVPVML